MKMTKQSVFEIKDLMTIMILYYRGRDNNKVYFKFFVVFFLIIVFNLVVIHILISNIIIRFRFLILYIKRILCFLIIVSIFIILLLLYHLDSRS